MADHGPIWDKVPACCLQVQSGLCGTCWVTCGSRALLEGQNSGDAMCMDAWGKRQTDPWVWGRRLQKRVRRFCPSHPGLRMCELLQILFLSVVWAALDCAGAHCRFLLLSRPQPPAHAHTRLPFPSMAAFPRGSSERLSAWGDPRGQIWLWLHAAHSLPG